MVFSLNAPMFDFLVLSIVKHGDAYGYQISQVLRKVSNAKDSTLYPILRRLQENGYVTTYDQPCQGRNRKYYRITREGSVYQQQLMEEWEIFRKDIEEIVQGGSDQDE